MRLSLLVAAVLAVAIVSGCGGSDSDDGGSASAASGADAVSAEQEEARVKLQNCLREQGVDLPEPGEGPPEPGDIDQDEIEEAMEACEEYRDEAFGEISEEDAAEFRDQFVKFRACMREQGVDLPDFEPGEGPPAGGGEIDPDDPEIQEAREACEDELPQGGPGGPGGFGGP